MVAFNLDLPINKIDVNFKGPEVHSLTVRSSSLSWLLRMLFFFGDAKRSFLAVSEYSCESLVLASHVCGYSRVLFSDRSFFHARQPAPLWYSYTAGVGLTAH
jgi:hypothetical protein